MSSDALTKIVKDLALLVAKQAEDQQAKFMVAAASIAVHSCALQALMRSHPDPAALRAAWDHGVSQMWAASGSIGTNPFSDEMRVAQRLLESALPDAG